MVRWNENVVQNGHPCEGLHSDKDVVDQEHVLCMSGEGWKYVWMITGSQ